MKIRPLFRLTVALLTIASVADANDEDFEQRVTQLLLDKPEIIIAALAILELREATTDQESDMVGLINGYAEILFGPNANGNLAPNSTALITEFFDYRCSFCAKSAPTTNALVEQLNGQVSIIELPILGQESLDLAKISIAVRIVEGTDKYFKFRQALIDPTYQPKNRASAIQLLVEMGLRSDEIERISKAEIVQEEIRRNRLLAQQLKISGTPSYVTKFGRAEGLQTLDQLIALIEGSRE